MSRSDTSQPAADVPYLPAGPGHACARACDDCGKRVMNLLGSKRRRRGQYDWLTCPACVLAKGQA